MKRGDKVRCISHTSHKEYSHWTVGNNIQIGDILKVSNFTNGNPAWISFPGKTYSCVVSDFELVNEIVEDYAIF